MRKSNVLSGLIAICLLIGTPLLMKGQSCYVSADDPVAQAWGNEKRAVAKILRPQINGYDTTWIPIGTGVLIMNTCGESTPYFLTAMHVIHSCGSHGGDWGPESLRYQFQYSGVTIKGATEVLSKRESDFSLLKLSKPPAYNSGVYYAGWDGNSSAAYTPIVILSHPAGGDMKYSADNQSPSAVGGECSALCWRLNLDVGAVTAGSSGAPYFNTSHRIIAQHHKYYDVEPCSHDIGGGKFYITYTYIWHWIDPNQIGFANTTSVGVLSPDPASINILGPATFCSSGDYTIDKSIPANCSIVWSTNQGGYLTITNLSNASCRISSTVYNGPARIYGNLVTPCGSYPIVYRDIIVRTGAPSYYSIYATLTTGGVTDWLKDANCLLTYTYPGMYSGNIHVQDPAGQPFIDNVTWTKTSQTNCSFADVSPSNNGKDVFLNFKPLGCRAVVRMVASNYCGSFTYNYTFVAGSSPLCNPVMVMMQSTPEAEKSITGAQILVYPNPSTGHITIDYNTQDSEAGIKEITITNNLGRKVFGKKYDNQRTVTLDISNQSKGLYFIEISDGEKSTCHQISIIQ